MEFFNIFSKKKTKDIDLTVAKFNATVFKLFGDSSIHIAKEIFENYCSHKILSDNFVASFDVDSMEDISLEHLNQILEEHSIFYSFCFGYYKLLAVLIALQGYKVTVLVEERVYNNQIAVFHQLIDVFEKRFNKSIEVELLTHKDINIIYKLKSRLNDKHCKTIVYVDGNKGNLDKSNNLQSYTFKGCKINFHQGYATLCWLLKQEKICGLICRMRDKKLTIDVMESGFIKVLTRKDYAFSVTSIILDNLTSLVTLRNIHQWDALVSVYQWFVVDENDVEFDETVPHQYIPFVLGHEFYALNRDNFMVHCIDKKKYNGLRKYNAI